MLISLTLHLFLTDGPFSEVYKGPEREYTCENLKPGQTYRTRVFCSSRGGDSQVNKVVNKKVLCENKPFTLGLKKMKVCLPFLSR